MKRFAGRAILITGGGKGIGAATARRLAAEGALALIVDIDERAAEAVAESARAEGGSAEAFLADLTDPEAIAALAAQVGDRIDRLFGLVNNAGIVRRASIEETSDADWQPQIDLNLRAPALLAQALLPLLKRAPGHIVNVSSEGGFKARSRHWVYDATKAGICAVTRSMAAEFAPFGMRVNSVAPGWTVTEMHFGWADDPSAAQQELLDKEYEGALIRRLARPEEIAAGIAFLLSDEASYITATTLHIDGGRTAR